MRESKPESSGRRFLTEGEADQTASAEAMRAWREAQKAQAIAEALKPKALRIRQGIASIRQRARGIDPIKASSNPQEDN